MSENFKSPNWREAQASLQNAKIRWWHFRKFKNFRMCAVSCISKISWFLNRNRLKINCRHIPEEAFFYKHQKEGEVPKDILGFSYVPGRELYYAEPSRIPTGSKTEKQLQRVPQEWGKDWQTRAAEWLHEVYYS